MLNNCFIFLFLFLTNVFAVAQNIPEKDMPFLQNYLPEDYGNHGKIWEIKSAKNGLIYMASENGLLEYDGENWIRYRASKGYTRSLHIVNDSVIFTGADMDFGIWKKNKLRKFQYTSLYPFNKKIGGVNEEFWGTYENKGKIIFISHQNLYSYYQKKLVKISAPTTFSESFLVNGRIFLVDERKGLFEYKDDKLKLVFSYPNTIPIEISGIFYHNNNLNIVSKNQGIFRLNNGNLTPVNMEVSALIIKNKVFSFDTLENKYLAFGTILDGLYLTDYDGNIIRKINKSTGLPNNTILSLHYQKSGRFWMGLDFGISYFDLKSNIKYFQSTNNNFGTGNTAVIKDQLFYLGTNQGLYVSDWKNIYNDDQQNSFKILKGSEGQVWTLQNIDGKVYCGHDNGLFEVNGESFTKIYDQHGILCLKKINDKYLLAGNYNGIAIFEKQGNTWKFLKKMRYILGAVSQIFQDKNGDIWINIPNYGIIRFNLDKNFNPVNRQFIATDHLKGNFPSLFIDSKNIRLITSAANYNYNFSQKIFEEEGFSSHHIKIKNISSGFYQPLILNSQYGFYSVNNGFAIEKFSNRQIKTDFTSHLLFRTAQAYNNDTIIDLSDGVKIPFRYNNLKFSFLIPNEDVVEYQYFLESFSENWSTWSSKNTLEFLGLKEGSYTLKIRAKNHSKISEIHSFKFNVKAPWYRSNLSYFLYFLVVLGLIFFIKKYNATKLKKQKLLLLKKEQNSLREQAEKHKNEMLLQRQKQLEIEQNNLREEIRNKTIELATKAKDDDEKNRILYTISEKIVELENNPNVLKIRLGEMRRLLKTYLETEDNTFEIQMDDLHQEFFKNMKKRFPNLSIYDLRLCAYLRIGLTSKEMADILQVLPSSINVSRSRLRKKLNLLPEDDLYEFLINL